MLRKSLLTWLPAEMPMCQIQQNSRLKQHIDNNSVVKKQIQLKIKSITRIRKMIFLFTEKQHMETPINHIKLMGIDLKLHVIKDIKKVMLNSKQFQAIKTYI